MSLRARSGEMVIEGWQMFFSARNCCMTRGHCVMFQQLLFLPHVMLLPLKTFSQPWQNLCVKITSNDLSTWYERMVHQTVDVKEFCELFDCPL
jgi:hypothetical protein